MLALRYGDPPQDGQDIGTVNAPKEISNVAGEGFEANEWLFDLYGLKLPPWARVRYVMRLAADVQKPYKCSIPGLGVLYVGDEGWEVR